MNKIQGEPDGKSRPNYILYEQLLVGCLDKIRKTVPRKCKELRDLCGEAIEQVKADADDEPLSANKYFRILKLALDTKIPRLTEQILYHIQRLVAHGLMDGNHPDDCIYPEDERPKSNGTLPRRLIDAIVDEVCKCTSERDQQVQLQVVRALLTLVATQATQVHERSLLKVMSSLYYIHIACTNPVNQNTAKASLIQMISIVFKKMEQHSGDFSESLRRLNAGESAGGTTQDTQRLGSQPSSRMPSSRDEEAKVEDVEQTLVTFTPEEQYAHVTLAYLIDNVCIHSSKQDDIRQHFIQQIQGSGNDEGQIQALIAQCDEEEAQVPLFAVPRSSKSRKKGDVPETAPMKREHVGPPIVNEQGVPSGKFGWCISCRQPANLYCKHTRHPVCSFECKQRHIKLLEEAQATHDEVQLTRTTSQSGTNAPEEPHARDALLVFNKLCQLLQSKDLDGKLDNVYDVRKVLLGLDLIHSCLENPGSTFINRKEFVSVIRDQLGGALLKFAVSSEHKIFSRTVSIFYCLFLHFREHLKQTIGVFIDNFFLKILDSGNSEYDYKYSILEFFDRLTENTDHILEIFANYDCDISQKDICGRMLDSLSTIAQGRFMRTDHTSVISPQQEASLRRQALEIRVKLLRNLNRAIEAEVRLEGLAQSRLVLTRQEKAAMMSIDNKGEEDDSNSRGDQSLMTEQEGDDVQDLPLTSIESMDAKQQMQNRLYKSEMAKAAGKFNLKPKNGIKYLTDKGFLPKEPLEDHVRGITKFLKETPALSATIIGQYMGEDKEPNKNVLSHYIDEMDFSNKELTFAACMKQFLTGFRIPGEGQIIDRYMEKFGEKLSRDRPEDFGNTEGVYLLAYATLMLQTSVHNPQAHKMKMSLQDFRKITMGVKLNEDPTFVFDDFLEDVYNTVLRDPFTLEEDEDARMKIEAASSTNKKLLFDKEREGILRRGAAVLKQDQKNNKFIMIKDISTIRPMFENTWSANLAVFSVVLDETEDPIIADLCLQGFMHAIRISGHFEIHDVRNAFVSSLSKFTQVSASKELREKNINCIRELLNLAIHDGDCLRDSWSYVLDCISKIDHMRVLGLGDLTDSEYFQSEAGANNQNIQINQQLLMRNSAIIAEQIDANQIETIFLQSEKLNPDAIIDFIENLCRVSREELGDEDSPKKFCLQKIVEVASLNMDRVRFQWQSIWRTLGEHFTWVGSHKNLHVVIYAIDSLRQLSDKFLEKEERKNFSYQKMFLKPFETIMLNNLHSRQKEIKEYIVMCISALCHQKAKYIKSGWEVILNIFTLAAQDTEPHLVVQSFQSLEHAVINHFALLNESFIELVNCLSKFARNGLQSSKALSLLTVCAARLKDQPQIVDGYVESHGHALHLRNQENMSRQAPSYGIYSQLLKKQENKKNKYNADPKEASMDDIKLSVLKELWFPILRNITGLISEKSEQIRQDSLKAFEQILQEHHQHFGDNLWKEVFSQVFLPAFEDIRLQVELAARKGNNVQAQSHIMTIQSLLGMINNFFRHNQENLTVKLLTCYTDIMLLFASNLNNKTLASVVTEQFRALIIIIGEKFTSPSDWKDVIKQISLTYEATAPKLLMDELKNAQSSQEIPDMSGYGINMTNEQKEQKNKYEQCYAKSTVQLGLTTIVNEIVLRFFNNLNLQQIQTLLDDLNLVYRFSIEFNSEVNLRFKLWKSGYMSELDHLPGLLPHEMESLRVYLSILFKQFHAKHSNITTALFEGIQKVLKDYNLKHSELISINTSKSSNKEPASAEDQLSALHETELEKQLTHMGPIVDQVILENLLNFKENEFNSQNVKDLGQLLVDLTLCDDSMVRNKNHKVLSRLLENLQKN